MAEYINREELIANLNKFAPEHLTPLIMNLIDKQPTADVVEVKHGEWISNEFGNVLICSECGRREHCEEPYCHCGAKMDGNK